MKKILMMFAAAALAFAMAGCNSGGMRNSGISATGEEATEGAPETTVIQGEIAWSESVNAEEAAQSAGFTGGFYVPSPLPIGSYPWTEPSFTAMDHVAQADYDGDGICASIRKGEGVSLEDLSADLNQYNFDWVQDCEGIQVTCHGYEEGIANFLEWESEGCSYDVWCVSTKGGNLGMNADEVFAMVTSIW